MRTFGADDGKPPRTPAAWMISPAPLLPPKEHAFGVDDDPLPRIPRSQSRSRRGSVQSSATGSLLPSTEAVVMLAVLCGCAPTEQPSASPSLRRIILFNEDGKKTVGL